MTISPKGLTVMDWCDSMAFILGPVMAPQKLLDPTQWKAWALSVIQSPPLARFQPPDPEDFDHWEEWADRFNQAVEAVL